MPRKRRSTTGEIADKIIPIRLTASEYAVVKAQAGVLSLSEFFRRAGLGLKIPTPRPRPVVPEVNRLTYRELGHIGTNLNQLAKACNMAIRAGYGCNIDPQQLRVLAEYVGQVRLEVLGADRGAEEIEE